MDYEYVAKSAAAKKVFGHHLRHLYKKQARAWATENFGPEAQVERADMDEEYKAEFSSRRYVFDSIGTWAYVSGDYYFRDINQAFEFKMRWG